jgi:hypothetical protein
MSGDSAKHWREIGMNRVLPKNVERLLLHNIRIFTDQKRKKIAHVIAIDQVMRDVWFFDEDGEYRSPYAEALHNPDLTGEEAPFEEAGMYIPTLSRIDMHHIAAVATELMQKHPETKWTSAMLATHEQIREVLTKDKQKHKKLRKAG